MQQVWARSSILADLFWFKLITLVLVIVSDKSEWVLFVGQASIESVEFKLVEVECLDEIEHELLVAPHSSGREWELLILDLETL